MREIPRMMGKLQISYASETCAWCSGTGTRAVSVWTVTGTAADGEALEYQGCDIYEFRGDEILNKDTYWKLVEQRPRL